MWANKIWLVPKARSRDHLVVASLVKEEKLSSDELYLHCIHIVLYCIILYSYCIVLYCIVLIWYCIVLY